jgi:hypothetical protein
MAHALRRHPREPDQRSAIAPSEEGTAACMATRRATMAFDFPPRQW